MDILIIGGGLQALSVASSLKKKGHIVIALLYKGDISTKSRYINKLYTTDITPKDTKGYLSSIHHILKNNFISVIIPLSDATAELLSLYKEELEQVYRLKCAIPNYDIFQKANDKWLLLSICAQNNLPHPKTELLTPYNLQEVANKVGFPALIKPNISVGARGITMVHSLSDLQGKYGEILEKYGESTLQEYIDNPGAPYYNVMMYRNQTGNIVNTVIIEIVRYYPIKGGSSSFCKTIESKELSEICFKTLEVLNWVGFADFDILKTKNGDFKIIEINPRVPASVRAAEISGVNFPDLIVNDALNLKINPYSYVPNKQLRYLGLDIMWFISSNKRFLCTPSWFVFFSKNLYYQESGAILFSL
ncbi:ATP-grasp domain-containing protein, partial [Bacteroides sp.]|uniref:carboxylate--amine ligase n=1 Tax=Bacteroides sp. TaxID=29523 RepID=UPI003A93DFD9